MDRTMTAPKQGGEIITERAAKLTREQVELLKRTVCKGASDDELALFMHVAQRSGLDPFARQIYAVKRWDAREQRETMSVQTGIDGYRVTAQRTGQYAGNDEPKYGPANQNGHPAHATVTVYRMVCDQRCAFSATARWDEYKQIKKDGGLGPMWARMPYLMLGKCAEALALRKAFPAELSGIYTHEEMSQADSEPRIAPAPQAERDAPPQPAPPPDKPPAPAKATPSKPVPAGLAPDMELELKDHPCSACAAIAYTVKRASQASKNPGRLYLACAQPECVETRNGKSYPTFGGWVDEVLSTPPESKEA